MVASGSFVSTVDSARSMIIVHPPPGVSSIVSVPPIAVTKPLLSASPSPTPVPFGWSPSRWNGSNTRAR